MSYQFSDDGLTVTMPDGRTLNRQRRRYFSRVRQNAARTGSSGAYIYTVPQGTVRAFSYRIGDDMAGAGQSGRTANKSDTNVELGRRPNQGDAVFVRGIGIQVLPRSNHELLKQVVDRTVISIEHSAGGNNEILGHLTDFPSGRGLSGAGESRTGRSPIAGGPAETVGAMQNGLPALQNVHELDVPLVWDGLADSFALAFEATEAIALATQMVDQTAGAGILGLAMPADGTVFVDYLVHLIGEVYSTAPVQG